MKKAHKTILGIAKVFALSMAVAFAVSSFTSCSSDDDDASVVTTWTAEYDGAAATLNFFDDDSFEVLASGLGTVMKGTYTGDTTKDGTIKLTITHGLDENNQLQSLGGFSLDASAKITDKKLTVSMPVDGEDGNSSTEETETMVFTKK